MTHNSGAGSLLSIVLVASMLGACGSDDTLVDPTQGGGDLSGVVAFVKTGSGVPGLVVALLQNGEVVGTTHTDASGLFQFQSLAEGTYTARLTGMELAGLNPRATVFDPVERVVTLSGESVDLAFATVSLVPPRVTGDVTCGGVPVEGASIRVIGGEDADVTVLSDVRGRFAATNLSQGVYAAIPVSAPCALSPAFQSVQVGAGQAGEVDFAG
ncbi:MAG: hypothetical protein OEZ65_05815 [Gemmatimonadota bacterium]|nr:hypothetical protein [Gemmatimonadota bacterium]